MSERPPLVGRVQRAQQSYWFAATAGFAEAAASGLLPAFNGSAVGRTTGQKPRSSRCSTTRSRRFAEVVPKTGSDLR
jgi:hypothetical protein